MKTSAKKVYKVDVSKGTLTSIRYFKTSEQAMKFIIKFTATTAGTLQAVSIKRVENKPHYILGDLQETFVL